jgi:hypothetical protein
MMTKIMKLNAQGEVVDTLSVDFAVAPMIREYGFFGSLTQTFERMLSFPPARLAEFFGLRP